MEPYIIIKALLQSRFCIRNIDMYLYLHKIGITDLVAVQTLISDYFGKRIEVTENDTIYSLSDKVKAV